MECSAILPSEAFLVKGMGGGRVGGGGGVCRMTAIGGDSSGSFQNRLYNHPTISCHLVGTDRNPRSNPEPTCAACVRITAVSIDAIKASVLLLIRSVITASVSPSVVILIFIVSISIISTINPDSICVNKKPIIFVSTRLARPSKPQMTKNRRRRALWSATVSWRAPGEPSHQHLADWIQRRAV